MKQLTYLGISTLVFLLIITIQPAMAYVGPGAGIAALGAFLAIVAGVVAAIFGFLWFPIKRLLAKRKSKSDKNQEGEQA